MSQINRWRVCVLLLSGVLLAAGCGRPSAGDNGGVAVIDMNKVAQAIGADQAIYQARMSALSAQQNRLALLDNEIKTVLARADADKSDTPERHQQRMTELVRTAQQRMQKEKDDGDEAVRQAGDAAVTRFRLQVRPIAESVARSVGRSVVLALDEAIIGYDPAADITNAVIEQIPRPPSPPSPPQTMPSGNATEPQPLPVHPPTSPLPGVPPPMTQP